MGRIPSSVNSRSKMYRTLQRLPYVMCFHNQPISQSNEGKENMPSHPRKKCICMDPLLPSHSITKALKQTPTKTKTRERCERSQSPTEQSVPHLSKSLNICNPSTNLLPAMHASNENPTNGCAPQPLMEAFSLGNEAEI